MALLPVAEALERLLGGVKPLGCEMASLDGAGGRVLAADITAMRTQPPFDASAMDGYAVRAADIAEIPARLSVIGSAPAGRRFDGLVGSGQAVRIFTGAPVPEGADTILLQEDARVLDDAAIEALEATPKGRHIRKAGLDFAEGHRVLPEGRLLDPAALSLAAAANHPRLPVVRRPLVAVLATGDELASPGQSRGPDQIVASNGFGIGALARADGAEILDLGIVPDSRDAIGDAIQNARDAGADIIVTLGGASVGDHDLVRGVLTDAGMDLAFWKIAMRPGKPLMVGRFGDTQVLGLPGNPVSSLVCAHLFLRPLIARMGGRSYAPDLRTARLGAAMKENDQRQDYVRAFAANTGDGYIATPFPRQDSSMLSTLADANCLIIRAPFAAAIEKGAQISVLLLR